ncbi:MAG: excinuclease ABC subunit UvrA [Clostridiales bacterium]|nr:MAG: excinuclease ABC subunit UvrA [Clostridiales bacterium]
MNKYIKVYGARENNLKNIDVEIPRDKLVVFTGLSGSGKSSLAFDTIYAEGHRRFVESLSAYARMFLGQMDKPDVDRIEGLSPAISIDQKTTSKNPRSTVGTVTEIYDYLRLLYARCGTPHCPVCGKEIVKRTVDSILDEIMELPEGTKFYVLAPMVKGKKGTHAKLFSDLLKSGYVRVRVDGEIYNLTDNLDLDKNLRHDVDVVVDRLVMKNDLRTRLSDSVENACKASGGLVIILLHGTEIDGEKERLFSQNFACTEHGISLGELEPRMFSFNSPFGACPECDGLGEKYQFSVDKLFPDKTLSLAKGACACNGYKKVTDESWSAVGINTALAQFGYDIHTPLCKMSDKALKVLLYGAGEKLKYSYRGYALNFAGIITDIQRRYEQCENNPEQREYYEQFMENVACPACSGKRLKKESLAVTVGDLNISECCEMSVSNALEFFKDLKLDSQNAVIAKDILKEIRERLGFLCSVGLEYLTLSRRSGTLSGGESQRIRLATQIGSSLMGVLYILDEPSIGLHQRDNSKLIATLKKLRDLGNTLIVVEHDEETMLESDYIIDIGPGAGIHGGKVVAAGTPAQVMKQKGTATADFLSGRRKIAVPEKRRTHEKGYLEVFGAREHNLKNIDVKIPLGVFTCVTGVSGSGKSSLVNGIILPALAHDLNGAYTVPGSYDKIKGTDKLDKVISIDQSPIGRTPRSNPATYTGLFTDIRILFASTQDAQIRCFKQDRFSFNLKGGRCEACQGDGTLKIEMHFLPDVYVTCDTCHGKRYNRETLEVKYKGKSISDVLEMTVDEGCEFFSNIPKIYKRLKTMQEVGLGYIKIGQSSTTLSGGEAQRVKLSAELSKTGTGNTLYILDEPTTGLHSADVEKLVEVLQKLVDAGNTVVVIEHNLDMIKTADYIVDLGPEGGDGGGTVVACGTPEQIAECEKSYTGEYLKKYLPSEKSEQKSVPKRQRKTEV